MGYPITTKVKSLIHSEVSMGTYGLVELEVRALEQSNKDMLEALEATKMLNLHLYEEGTIGNRVYNQITNAINKATK